MRLPPALFHRAGSFVVMHWLDLVCVAKDKGVKSVARDGG